MDTRRLYISSKDSTQPYPQNEGLTVSLKSAIIRCEADQNLAVSLVRAELPTTLEAITRTTEIGTSATLAISLLRFEINGSEHILYFNDYDNINVGAGHARMIWNLQTTIQNIVNAINTLSGGDLTFNSDAAGNRLQTTADTFVFSSKSSKRAMRALGLYTTDFVFTTVSPGVPAPYEYNLSNALPVLYISTNLAVRSFTSRNGGNMQNILGSIPLSVDSQVNGYKLLAKDLGSIDAETIAIPAGINYINVSNSGSHKPIGQSTISSLTLLLQDSEGRPVGTGMNSWSCTLEVKTVSAI